MAITYVTLTDPGDGSNVLYVPSTGAVIPWIAGGGNWSGSGYYNVTDDGAGGYVLGSPYVAPPAPPPASSPSTPAAPSAPAAPAGGGAHAPSAPAPSAPSSSTTQSSAPATVFSVPGLFGTTNQKKKSQYVGSWNSEEGGNGLTSTTWKGAGYYSPEQDSEGNQYMQYLGSIDPNAISDNSLGYGAYSAPTEGGYWTLGTDPNTGGKVAFRQAGQYDEGAQSGQDILAGVLKQVGVTPEQFAQQLKSIGYTGSPYALLAAGYNAAGGSNPLLRSVRQGQGTGDNPATEYLGMLEAAGYDWTKNPQLVDLATKGYYAASTTADTHNKINTAPISTKELLMTALSVYGPGLFAALGPVASAGFASGGAAGAAESVGNALAAGSAAKVGGAPLMGLATKGLNIIDPRLGAVASLVGSVNGLFNGAAPSADTLGATQAGEDAYLGKAMTQNYSDMLANTQDAQDAILGRAMTTNYNDMLANTQDAQDAALGQAMKGISATPNSGVLDNVDSLFNSPAENPVYPGPSTLDQANEMFRNTPAQPEAPTQEAPQTETKPTTFDPKKLLGISQDVYKILADQSPDTPEGQKRKAAIEQEMAAAPQQSDNNGNALPTEQYVSNLANWAGIPETNLNPASSEYFTFVTTQTDKIINGILGKDAEFLDGKTPAELSDLLKDKREDELRQLARALYVRGQLSTLTSADKGYNPFSGETVDLNYAGETNPALAAVQRGFAQESTNLAGKRGTEARDYYNSLVNRQQDLYGMQARADADMLRAKLETQIEEEQRKKKGYKADTRTLQDIIENLDTQDVKRLLAPLGNEQRMAAALQQLFFSAEGQ